MAVYSFRRLPFETLGGLFRFWFGACILVAAFLTHAFTLWNTETILFSAGTGLGILASAFYPDQPRVTLAHFGVAAAVLLMLFAVGLRNGVSFLPDPDVSALQRIKLSSEEIDAINALFTRVHSETGYTFADASQDLPASAREKITAAGLESEPYLHYLAEESITEKLTFGMSHLTVPQIRAILHPHSSSASSN